MTTSPIGRAPGRSPGRHAGPRETEQIESLWPEYVAPVGARAPRLWWEDDDTVPSGMPAPAAAFRYETPRRPRQGARTARPERRTAPPAASHPMLYAFLGLSLGLLISATLLGAAWWVLFGH